MFFIVILLMCGFLLTMTVIMALAKNDYERNNLVEVTVSYELSKVQLPHNIVYVFALENGDKLQISSEFLNNKDCLSKYEQLKFTYAKPLKCIPASYTLFSIASAENEVCFVNGFEVKKDIQGKILTFTVIFVLLFLIGSCPLFLNVLVKIALKSKKH